ncbi:abortive phage infection protein [Actinoplanes sp. SE50]|uniref:CPBP family intramembrane glutamic endopeptidase n=1 Tax=unclassified Actinoplanes TaxID=2626549 RepID=UPI00023ED5EC|nr:MULTISPECIES: CPBP family intramembrane glutamic endopeptidase [unclassified Actinoplanes]AEV84461.1 Lysostaphin resistance protein A [Actinoplanes sp. SE50/110]ATO82853.1 abortive phage infection protein [Actinoplanes sp. SE50]SLM00261.1 abortive infection protein [Actinoplanes sp. SE50/110]
MATVFFAVATVAAGVFGAVQPFTGIPEEVIQLTQFGPAVAVAVLAGVWPARTRALLHGAGSGEARTGPVLLSTAVLIVAGAVGAHGVITGGVGFTRPEHPFLLIAVAQLIGACGEEIGWRCLLQPLLRTRFGPLTASVLVGLLWGLWHVPVFAEGPWYGGLFLLATIALSVVMGLALERARSYRLLLAAGFHTLINLGMLLFMNEESGAVLPIALFGASAAVAALVGTASRR